MYHAIPDMALNVMAIGRVVIKPPVIPLLEFGMMKSESRSSEDAEAIRIE
jgi:hypothetical protein